jgi:hypothetical protein
LQARERGTLKDHPGIFDGLHGLLQVRIILKKAGNAESRRFFALLAWRQVTKDVRQPSKNSKGSFPDLLCLGSEVLSLRSGLSWPWHVCIKLLILRRDKVLEWRYAATTPG